MMIVAMKMIGRLKMDIIDAMDTAESWLMLVWPVFSFLLGSSGITVVTNVEQRTEVQK